MNPNLRRKADVQMRVTSASVLMAVARVLQGALDSMCRPYHNSARTTVLISSSTDPDRGVDDYLYAELGLRPSHGLLLCLYYLAFSLHPQAMTAWVGPVPSVQRVSVILMLSRYLTEHRSSVHRLSQFPHHPRLNQKRPQTVHIPRRCEDLGAQGACPQYGWQHSK